MMESTRQIEETLVSLNQQGLEEFDRPPADVIAFKVVVSCVPSMRNWLGSPTTSRTRR